MASLEELKVELLKKEQEIQRLKNLVNTTMSEGARSRLKGKSATAARRHWLMENDPDKYEEIRTKQRERERQRREKMREQFATGTRAAKVDKEAYLARRREISRKSRANLKVESSRQTRTSRASALPQERVSLKGMTLEERNYHRNARRREAYRVTSKQKKVAVKKKHAAKMREFRLRKKLAKCGQITPNATNTPKDSLPQTSTTSATPTISTAPVTSGVSVRQHCYNTMSKKLYLRPDVSRVLPHGRYATKHGPGHVMIRTLDSAYKAFCEETNGNVSRALFSSLRPMNVRKVGTIAAETCLVTHSDLLSQMSVDLYEPVKGASYMQHLFNAYWQQSQYNMCKDSLKQGQLLMVQDFAKNQTATYYKEVKSVFLGKQQIMLHPSVCWYKDGQLDNGASLKIVTAHTLDEGANKMPVTSKLSNQDISRYSRQLILPELGVKGQINLKNSSVLIVGAGGLGCPAAIYLAAAGIGRLGVVDYDAVELSNLHRQILHSENRISVPKSLSIAQSCQQLNSSIEYVPYQLQLDSTNALDIIRKYDIVLDATDNVATRYLLNDACVLEGKPLISGSALRFEGQLTVYNHNGGPCYRCLFPLPPPPETVTNCSEGGVIGVVPGIIGSLQALEAIKMASGIGTSYSQRLLMFDALDGTFHTPTLRPRSVDCCMCGDQPTISQLIDYEQFCGARACDKNPDLKVLDEFSRISPKEYSTMLTDGVPHVLVDVRSAVETEICALPHPALSIPLTTLTRDRASAATNILQAVDNVAKEMPNDNRQDVMPVVFVCRRGNDSQLAVRELQEKLRDRDLRIVDIERGLYGWSRQVDQQFPVY